MKAKFTKEMWTDKKKCSLATWMLLPARRNLKINLDEQQAIFEDNLQSARRLKVGFFKICCEL